MNSYYLSLFLSIAIGVVGQITIKSGSLNPDSSGIMIYLQPYVILGLFCYSISALLYIYALKQIPVSVAFPSVSLSYVAVALLAHFLWNEPFGIQQIMALLLILSGVFLLIRA